MNKILFLFFSLLLFASFLFYSSSINKLLYYSACDDPIPYRVDTVDPKFNLSREEFVAEIDTAVQIWEQAAGRDLFVYKPEGDLSINLIYDERQSLTSRIKQLENKVKSDKEILNPQMSEYKRMSADFKQKISDLNREIENWNNQGGAPPDEYQKLIDKQQELSREAANINALAKSLNISADAYNDEVNNLNQTIDTFNSALEERPEEGIFKGSENRIEIYFNITKDELIHTLAHEFGHALGIGHVNNPSALMYAKTSQKLTPTKEDLAEIEYICRQQSIFEIIQARLALTYAYYKKLLNF